MSFPYSVLSDDIIYWHLYALSLSPYSRCVCVYDHCHIIKLIVGNNIGNDFESFFPPKYQPSHIKHRQIFSLIGPDYKVINHKHYKGNQIASAVRTSETQIYNKARNEIGYKNTQQNCRLHSLSVERGIFSPETYPLTLVIHLPLFKGNITEDTSKDGDALSGIEKSRALLSRDFVTVYFSSISFCWLESTWLHMHI